VGRVNILILSNAPHVPSGYGVQTALLAPRLRALGHEVAILAMFGIRDTVTEFEGIKVFPGSRNHAFAQDVMVPLARQLGVETVLANVDAWIVEAHRFQGTGIAFVPWFPVDSEPIDQPNRKALLQATLPVAASLHAKRMAEAAGVQNVRHVPYAVDAGVFCRGDRAEAREFFGLPESAFVCGLVAMNKTSQGVDRKRFFEQIGAFARFAEAHDDALLYLHTTPLAADGVDVGAILDFWKVPTERVHITGGVEHWLGLPPPLLARMYRSFDVLLGCSGGEGAGVPLLEAAACGTPAVFGDWTGMPEYAHGGFAVRRDEAQPQMNAGRVCWYTPRIDAIADRLEQAYSESDEDRAVRAEDARAGAVQHDAVRVAVRWHEVLGEVAELREASQRARAVPVPEVLRPKVSA
jgi:glycosyltransferase involved in cell wall biosynthesis